MLEVFAEIPFLLSVSTDRFTDRWRVILFLNVRMTFNTFFTVTYTYAYQKPNIQFVLIAFLTLYV